ncbi:OmpA family protein [Streptomyces gobiensis]|nr:OmpA family protein [Streptomyces gobiensis]UGY95202.1 OmpA family protein [Streptomyces gobiensis]
MPFAAAVTALVVLFSGGALTATAHAEDGPSYPPGTEPNDKAPVEVDANHPGLKMVDGAKLAEPKVLDIKMIVEDEDGEEVKEESNQEVKFRLQSEVLFGKDSAKLNSKSHARIKEIAEEINKQNASEVRVFGFTDNLGSYEHGMKLSNNRAKAVHTELVKSIEGSPTYQVRGYSEDYPVADNSTEEGRKKNRRVEISFPRGE